MVAVLLFALGIWCGAALDLRYLFLSVIAAIVWFGLTLCFVSSRYSSIRRVSLLCLSYSCMALIGWCVMGFRLHVPLDRMLESLSQQNRGDVEIIGTVKSDPVCRSLDNSRLAWRFSVCVEKIRDEKNERWVNTGGVVDVYWYAPKSGRAPRYGEKWAIPGVCDVATRRHTGPQRFRGIWYRARSLSSGHGNRFVAACLAARGKAARQLTLGIEDHVDNVALLRALLLGYRQELRQSVKSAFSTTGTLHIFAISGLHVGILALLIIGVLRALRVSRIHWILFLAPLLITYTLATGARASAVRACIMAIVFFVAALLKRKSDSPCALALAAFLILVASPFQLFDIGFIYSFVIVAGLIVLCPLFDQVLRRVWEADPWRVDKEPKWIVWSRSLGRYICSLIAVSWAAWLVSAPITAYFFGRFAPIALFSNLVVIPLAFAIVVIGCLSLGLGLCVSCSSVLFNHVNLGLSTVLIRVMAAMSRVPLGSFEIGRIPLWCVILWYAVLIGCVVWIRTRNGQPGQQHS